MASRYNAIKEMLVEQGFSNAEAEQQAAKLYNDSRKAGEPSLGEEFSNPRSTVHKRVTAKEKV